MTPANVENFRGFLIMRFTFLTRVHFNSLNSFPTSQRLKLITNESSQVTNDK